jgi:aminoglycoside 3-N-acetyltransferase
MESYSRQDISNALRSLPIGKGDVVFSHSNLAFFGKPEGNLSKNDICEMFFDAIMDVIGPNGTLVVPTFTYSFPNGEDFCVASTPSKMGMFAEWVRNHPNSGRSIDPSYSMAAIGGSVIRMLRQQPENSFDFIASSFARLCGVEAKVLNFNMGAASTLIHYIERFVDVPYRFDKTFSGTIIEKGVSLWIRNTIYVRYLHPGLVADFGAFNSMVKSSGMFRTARIGSGEVGVISASDTFDAVTDGLKEFPWFLTAAGKTGEIPTNFSSLQ